MYSKYDYLYNPPNISIGGNFNVFNIIIIILLVICFYILINNFSIGNFTNIKSKNNNDNDECTVINNLKNELQLLKNELISLKPEKQISEVIYINNPVPPIQEEILSKTNIVSSETNVTLPQTNIKSQDTNIVSSESNVTLPQTNIISSETNINLPQTNTKSPDSNIIFPPSPPIIYDPIEAYDRKKLLDPLIDPRGRSSADQIPTPQVAAQLNFPTQGIIDRYHRVGLLIAIDDHHTDKKNLKRRNHNDYEDFGNIEKIDKSGKVFNIDSDSSSNSSDNKFNRYKDNSSDITTIDDSDIKSFNNGNYKKKIIPNNVVLELTDRDNDILELIGKKIANEWYRYFTSISKGNKIIKINVHNRNRKELYDGDIVYIPILKRYYRVKIDKLDMIEYNPYFF